MRQYGAEYTRSCKASSPDDDWDVYDLLQALPADENGFMNPANGLSYDQYRDWLRFAASRSEQTGIIDGVVPETIFWLYEDGKPVGMGKVRHLMTEALLANGGRLERVTADRHYIWIDP